MDVCFADMIHPERTPDAEYAYLSSVLQQDFSRIFRVRLPACCEPDCASLVFLYSEGTYALRFARPVSYHGSDPAFASLCSGESFSFCSMDGLKDFMRSLHPDDAPAANDVSAARVSQEPQSDPPAIPSTDRSALTVETNAPDTVRLDAERLFQDITKQVRGQDDAIHTVVRYACAAASKSAPQRPFSILLAGETGQGKTLLCKTLARAMNRQIHDRRKHYDTIIVHCNELTEAHDVSRLTGASPNYVGYGDDNLLSPVQDNPYQVVLFDEIEKASKRVLDVLMGVLDCGEIMLSKPVNGSSILNMKHCILLFTTNLRLDSRPASIGFRDEPETAFDRVTQYRDALTRSGIRREIAGRFSDIVVFSPLNAEAVVDIILLSIQNCASEFGFSVNYVAPELVQEIYANVDASAYGARMINTAVAERFGLFFSESSAAGTHGTFALRGTPGAMVLEPA